MSLKIFYGIIVQEGTLRGSSFVSPRLHKALNRSIITTPALPGNLRHTSLPRTVSNFPSRTLQYAWRIVTKLCRKGTEVIEITRMRIFATMNKVNPNTKKKFSLAIDPIPDHGLPFRGFAFTFIGHITLVRTSLDE